MNIRSATWWAKRIAAARDTAAAQLLVERLIRSVRLDEAQGCYLAALSKGYASPDIMRRVELAKKR